MMLQNKLEDIWDRFWEGRLLLINIASQIDNSLLKKSALKIFLDNLSNSNTRLQNVCDLNHFFFGSEDSEAFDATMCGIEASNHCSTYLIRVSPLSVILRSISLLNKSGLPDSERTNRALNELRPLLAAPHPQNDHPQFQEAEKAFRSAERILCDTLFPTHIDPIQINRWKLPDALQGLPLAAASVESGIGIAMQEPNATPKFFSPIGTNCPICAAIPRTVGADNAQRLRDLLGLDAYGACYGAEATILGFFVLRFDATESEAMRPTAFDWTSRARFRARYGTSGKTVGRMGLTADLAMIERNCENLPGVREVVRRARPFNKYPARLFLGYLGRLAPNAEAYDERKRTMSKADCTYVDLLQGHWSRDDVIDKILQGIE